MTNLPSEYRPVFIQVQKIGYWWIITLLVFCGSVIGFVVSYFLPPVYEAVFQVTTNVNLEDNPINTEFMVDISILHVGELAYLPEILSQVIDEQRNQGITLTTDELRHISSVERRGTVTLLKVRWNDPLGARQIANSWGIIYFNSLQEGYRQAIIAENLASYQTTLENCFSITQDTPSIKAYCGFEQGNLMEEISRNADEIYQANSLALGLYPALYVSGYQEAAVPNEPLYYDRGELIIAGTFLGFLFALFIIEMMVVKKKHVDSR